MRSRGDFYVGFMRGLNSVAEVFAPYHGAYESSFGGGVRSDWAHGREDMKNALGVAFAKIAPGSSKRPVAPGLRSSRSITRFVSAHWRGPLPPPSELERIEQTIPGGADRLLRMAERDLQLAEQELAVAGQELQMAQQDLQLAQQRLQLAQKEQTHRFEDSKRGQYLGFFLAAGTVIAAAVVSLFHAPWQVSVALVGIPMLGAVQALIQGRREKDTRRSPRWLERWLER
ncbi:MAG TPA: DUF2335 domain-containing protein [Steroidobacteraceae bacterium]